MACCPCENCSDTGFKPPLRTDIQQCLIATFVCRQYSCRGAFNLLIAGGKVQEPEASLWRQGLLLSERRWKEVLLGNRSFKALRSCGASPRSAAAFAGPTAPVMQVRSLRGWALISNGTDSILTVCLSRAYAEILPSRYCRTEYSWLANEMFVQSRDVS